MSVVGMITVVIGGLAVLGAAAWLWVRTPGGASIPETTEDTTRSGHESGAPVADAVASSPCFGSPIRRRRRSCAATPPHDGSTPMHGFAWYRTQPAAFVQSWSTVQSRGTASSRSRLDRRCS